MQHFTTREVRRSITGLVPPSLKIVIGGKTGLCHPAGWEKFSKFILPHIQSNRRFPAISKQYFMLAKGMGKMVYRIRYHDINESAEAEAQVEANSPSEAMVKFRCIHTTAGPNAQACEMVSSVSGDQPAYPEW